MKFVLVKPDFGTPVIETIECADNDDASFDLMQDSVDGNFELCTYYLKGLPENVDVWCNENCVFRPDLLPILTYEILNPDKNLFGYLKGNLLFTASDEEGRTIGLTDDQINGIRDVLENMPTVGLLYDGIFCNTYYSN